MLHAVPFARRPCGLLAAIQILVALLFAPEACADWLVNGSPIAANETIDQAPFSLTADAAGGFIIGWGDFVWTRASRVTPAGDIAPGWPPAGTSLNQYAYASSFPSTLPDGQGGAYVVMSSKWCPAHCPVDGTEVRVTHVRADGSIAAGWEHTGVAIGTGIGPVRHRDVFAPVGTTDARGGVVVVWSGSQGDGPVDLRAQRVDSTGALRWGPHGVVIRPPGSGGWLPAVMPDGSGGATVIWRDERGPALYAQHLDDSGAALWTPTGVPITGTLAPGFSRPVAVASGPHDLLVAWFGTSGRDSGLFATRLALRGERPVREPVHLLGAGSGIDSLRMVSARHGGAVLAWRDKRGSTGEAIFAQRMDVDGRPRWRPGGVPVCTAPGHKDYLSLAADGQDGAFFAWSDTRPAGEVFATHLDREGEPVSGWERDGSPICAPLAPVWAVQLVAGSEGDAFVVWTDDRRPLGTRFVLKTTQAMRLLAHGPVTPPTPPLTKIRPGALAGTTAPPDESGVLALRGMQPGPGLHVGRIHFVLADASPATLALFDISGRRLWTRDVGLLGAGEHVVPVADGAWIPAGVYLARLTQAHRVASARIVVVH